MKILLTTLNSKYVHSNLALKYLHLATKDNYDTNILEFTINDTIENIVSNIFDSNSDVVCFSVYIWNVEMTLKICKILKLINDEITIVLGGPEVSYNSKELIEKHNYIDYIILGEGENTIRNLLNMLEKNTYDILENVTSKNNIGNIGNVLNDNDIPRVAQYISDNYDGKIVYFETTRGCPFKCSYCLSSIEHTVRPFNIDRVKEELKILLDRNVTLIKFVDRTFNYNNDRAIELWQYMLDNRKGTRFHFEIDARILSDKAISFLQNVPSDIFQFEIGIQSTNTDTLRAINRNEDVQTVYNHIKELQKNMNIHLHVDLIAGLPFETYDIFKKSFNDVYILKTENIQLGFLKLLYGCPLSNDREKHNYVNIPYPPYEILSNTYISFEEIQKLKKIEDVLEKIYNSECFKYSLEQIEKKYTSPFEMYEDIARYFEQKGLFNRKISQGELYDVLFDMYGDIGEYIRLDYILKNNDSRYWFKQNEKLKEYINIILEDEKFCSKYIYPNIKKEYAINRSDILKTFNFSIFNNDILDSTKHKNVYKYLVDNIYVYIVKR